MKAVLLALLFVCVPAQLQTELDEIFATADFTLSEDIGAPLDLELRAQDYEGVRIPLEENIPPPRKYQSI